MVLNCVCVINIACFNYFITDSVNFSLFHLFVSPLTAELLLFMFYASVLLNSCSISVYMYLSGA